MALYYDTGTSPVGTTNPGGSQMNPSVMLLLAFMFREERRDLWHDRRRLYDELRAIFPDPPTDSQIWSLVDLMEVREGREDRREQMLPIMLALMGSQTQTTAATSGTTTTAPVTTGIDPTVLIALAMMS
jgi:hypothetical protein